MYYFAATVFLILSIWFAIHCMVIAQSCSTCLLQQSKQLRDLPSGTEIDAYRKRFYDYETEDLRKTVLRLPYWKRAQRFWRDPLGATKDQP